MAQPKAVINEITNLTTPRAQLENLQVLIYHLQLYGPLEWPPELKKAGLTYQDALTKIINFAAIFKIKIDSKNPQLFLAQLNLIISNLLLDQSAQPPSLPENLKELVAIHQGVKNDFQKREERYVHFKTDLKIQQAQAEFTRAIEEQLQGSTPLKEEVARQVSLEVAQKLPQVGSATLFNETVVPQEQFQQMLQETVLLYSAKAGIPQPSANEIKILAQEVYHQQAPLLAATPHQPRTAAVSIKSIIPPKQTEAFLAAKAQVEKDISLAVKDLVSTGGIRSSEEVELTKEISRALKSQLRHQPPISLSEQSYRQWLNKIKPSIKEALIRDGYALPKEEKLSRILDQIAKKTLTDAQRLKNTTPYGLPPNVIANLEASPEYRTGTPFLFFKNSLNRIKSQILTSAADTLPLPEETKKLTLQIINDGLTVEAIDQAIKKYQQAGLVKTHPLYQELLTLREQIFQVQKTSVFKEGKIQYFDKSWFKSFKEFYQPIYCKQIDTYLPGPVFRSVIGRLRISDRIIQLISGNQFVSFSQFGQYIYRNTLSKAVNWFTRNKFGSAIIGKWLTKLGLQAGLKAATAAGGAAAGAAAGTAIFPGAGTIIGFIAGFVVDKVGNLVKKLFQKIKEHPWMAVAAGLGVILIPGGIIGIAIGVPLLMAGGLSLAGGGAIGIGGLASGVTGFFSALLLAPIGTGATMLVVGVLGGLVILTLFIVFLTAGAFIVPNKPSELGAPGQEYFSVSKTANPQSSPNFNPVEVEYTIKIEPDKDQKIEISSITESSYVNCTDGRQPDPDFPLSFGNDEWSINFKKSFDGTEGTGEFRDCRICNTVTVVANVIGGPTGVENSSTACVKIGKPPEDCPFGWPMDSGFITQGPECQSITHQVLEAIDIFQKGAIPGVTPIKATHQGIAKVYPDPNNGYGKHVDINTICEGKAIVTRYAHLTTITVRDGQTVKFNDQVGTYGNTGRPRRGGVYAAHLHYEFRPFNSIRMVFDYVPITIPRGCCSQSTCKNIKW